MATEVQIDQLRRWSVDEYHRFIAAGGFDARVELIDGLIVEMSPTGDAHARVGVWLVDFLALGIDRERFRVAVTTGLVLERSEPEPDFMVFALDAPFRSGAELVVEVAGSSLEHDLRIKSRVYAEARVPEYWVVDLVGRRIVRHLDPVGSGYRRIDELREGDVLVASAVKLPALDLREFLEDNHL